MASCGSLQQIFEKNPLPENPSFIESLSPWNQIKPIKPIEVSSVTEIFGELHFKENSELSSSSLSSTSSPPSSPFSLKDLNSQTKNEKQEYKHQYTGCFKKCDGFSSKNSESLQLCTEGLGVESFDGIEESVNEKGDNWENEDNKKVNFMKHHQSSNILCHEFRRSSRTGGRSFPPPISCIGRSGKPWVCFKSYRQDGRFVLKEIRIPTQEFLHACREDGRLTLHFAHPEQEILEEDEDYNEEEEEENDAGRTDEEEGDDDDSNNEEKIEDIDEQKTDHEINEQTVEI